MQDLEKPRITDIITEENFDLFVQMHEAMEAGDYDTAMELREELGLGFGMRAGRGMHKGFSHRRCGMW